MFAIPANIQIISYYWGGRINKCAKEESTMLAHYLTYMQNTHNNNKIPNMYFPYKMNTAMLFTYTIIVKVLASIFHP